MQNHSAKKRKFHKKNRKAVYMPVEEKMGVISRFWWDDKDKSKTFLFVFLKTTTFLQFLANASY